MNVVVRFLPSERRLLARAARRARTNLSSVIRTAALLGAEAIVANGRPDASRSVDTGKESARGD